MRATDIPATPEYLTVPEVARLLRVSEPTVYRRVQDQTLPSVRVGEVGPIRIPVEGLARFLLPRGPVLAPGTPAGAVEARAHAGTQGDGERSQR